MIPHRAIRDLVAGSEPAVIEPPLEAIFKQAKSSFHPATLPAICRLNRREPYPGQQSRSTGPKYVAQTSYMSHVAKDGILCRCNPWHPRVAVRLRAVDYPLQGRQRRLLAFGYLPGFA